MHALLVSVGTGGDVYPYVGLGVRLRARGHRVTLVANEQFRTLAVEHGLAFRALVSDEETQQLLGNPDFWHPLKTAALSSRWGISFLARQYDLLAELAGDKDTVLAANPAVFAARVVQEKLARPMASILLQPWIIPSVFAPPTMPGWLTLPRWTPRLLGEIYWRLLDALGYLLVGRELNRLRASLRLKPARWLFQWWLSPDRVIGLFPGWYGPPQPDWPRQIRLVGFPMFDGQASSQAPDEVLEFCRAGAAPVAFTFGTGMMHATETFRAAQEACRLLGIRGLFLTRYECQVPIPLPPFIRHCPFAPFQQLFPHCAAVVHHGGIGTVAKALAAGTPQLILPMAFDQMDNAARVHRLGGGDGLRPHRRSGADMARALARLLSPQAQARSKGIATRFGNDDALDVAAQGIEDLADRDPVWRRRRLRVG